MCRSASELSFYAIPSFYFFFSLSRTLVLFTLTLFKSWYPVELAIPLHLFSTSVSTDLHTSEYMKWFKNKISFSFSLEKWFGVNSLTLGASLVSQQIKNPPAMQETWVQSLDWEDPLEKGMATQSSNLAWRIPWTAEPSRLQYIGLQRVRHDWVCTIALTLVSWKLEKVRSSAMFLGTYHMLKKWP